MELKRVVVGIHKDEEDAPPTGTLQFWVRICHHWKIFQKLFYSTECDIFQLIGWCCMRGIFTVSGHPWFKLMTHAFYNVWLHNSVHDLHFLYLTHYTVQYVQYCGSELINLSGIRITPEPKTVQNKFFKKL